MAALNVAGMMEAAKDRASNFAVLVDDETVTFKSALEEFTHSHAKMMAMPTATAAELGNQNAALDGLHDVMTSLHSKITAATSLVNGNLATAKTELQNTNDLLNNLKAKDYTSLNATTKKLLKDSATTYKQTFIAVCVKAGVCLLLIYVLLEHWFDIMVVFVGIIVLWAMLTAILFVWSLAFKKEASVPLKGTVDANTCPNDNYTKLALVCRNGMPDLGLCKGYSPCWDSSFGCCADAKTPMSTITDTCALQPCEKTIFGCCPNGVPKADPAGSNCTPALLCGSSAWGCNPDGSFMSQEDALKLTKAKLAPDASETAAESLNSLYTKKCDTLLKTGENTF